MGHNYTWEKLAQNAYRLNPKTRGMNYPYVPKWEVMNFTSGRNIDQNVVIPFKGTNSVLISLRAWGVTQASLHSVTLHFSDVDIRTENPQSSLYFPVQYNGQMYWVHKLDKRRNPLTSRCSCRDEFFVWGIWKHNAGCLYGKKPMPYIRKTTTYPQRNPNHIVGICKHVYHSWAFLRNSGMTLN